MFPVSVMLWSLLVLVFGYAVRESFRGRYYTLLFNLVIMAVLTLVRPVMFFLGMDTPHPGYAFPGEFWGITAVTLTAVLVWTLTLHLGNVASQGSGESLTWLFPSPGIVCDRRRLIFLVVLVFVISSATNFWIVSRYSSIGAFMLQVKHGKALAGFYVLRETATLSAVLSFYGILTLMEDRNRRRPGVWILGGMVAVSLFWIYLWGNRMNIALILMSMLFSWHLYVQKFNLVKAAVVVALGVGLMLLLRYIREILFVQVTGVSHKALDTMSFIRGLSLSLHFAEFDALMLCLKDAGSIIPFREGSDFIHGLTAWIPRQLWPDKPETHFIGGWLRQVYEPQTRNGWPPTVIGSWFLNFGWVGIGLGALVAGTLFRALSLRYADLTRNAFSAAFLPFFSVFLFWGGMNTNFFQSYVLYVVPVFLLSLALRVRVG